MPFLWKFIDFWLRRVCVDKMEWFYTYPDSTNLAIKQKEFFCFIWVRLCCLCRCIFVVKRTPIRHLQWPFANGKSQTADGAAKRPSIQAQTQEQAIVHYPISSKWLLFDHYAINQTKIGPRYSLYTLTIGNTYVRLLIYH
jgi:hypothetical protein